MSNPYYSTVVLSDHSADVDDLGPVKVEAYYCPDEDAHVVQMTMQAWEDGNVLTPSEALKIAAALTLAAEAAIAKDNS